MRVFLWAGEHCHRCALTASFDRKPACRSCIAARVRYNFTKSVLAFWLALVVLLPAGLPLVSSAAGADAGAWLCGPSQSLSADDKAELKDILTQIGEIGDSEDAGFGALCLDCITGGWAGLTPPVAMTAANIYVTRTAAFSPYDAGRFTFATGPPLGGRAPPHFQ